MLEGSPATFECKIVAGHPAPEIKWIRKETGELAAAGNKLEFSSASRNEAGTYVCSADNGYGPEPVTKEVKLEVECKKNVFINCRLNSRNV